MSNKIQFLYNREQKKNQKEIERLKIDACSYYGQLYDNIKHNDLIVNHLLQRYINELS